MAAFALAASGVLVGIVFGMNLAQPRYAPPENVLQEYPTGQEVLAELQNYRKELGLPEFEVSGILCNNIAERWFNYTKNNSHEGFHEFVQKQYPPGFTASEILAPGKTAEEVVNGWKQSPSHDYFIKNNTKVCVYSDSGYSVALLSN